MNTVFYRNVDKIVLQIYEPVSRLCPLTFWTWCWPWVDIHGTRLPGRSASCTSRTESSGWMAGSTLLENS